MYNSTILISKISQLCKDKNLSINQMLKDANLSASVIDNIKRGRIPSVDKLDSLADFFNCSVDYLIGRTSTASNSLNEELTEHEKKLLSAYRKNVNMQTAVDKLLGIDTNVVEVLKIARGKNSEPVRFKSDISDLKNAHMSDEDL